MKYIKLYGNDIGRITVLNLGVLALVCCVISYTTFTVSMYDIAFSLGICTFLYIISCGSNMKKLIGYSITAGITFYFIYKYQYMVYPSLLYTVNSFIDVLKQPYHLDVLPLALPHTEYTIDQQPIFMLLILILASIFHVLIKSSIGCIIILVITLPVCFLGLYFNVLPNSYSIIMIVAFWLALFILSDRQFEKKAAFHAVFAIVIVFFSAGIIQCVMPKAAYIHPHFMEYIPQSIQDFLDNCLSPSGRATSMDDIRHGIQGHGHLGDMDTLTQTGRKIMHVQTSLHINDCLYLRNYSGAVYENNSWGDLPNTVYQQHSKLFDAYSPGAWYDQSVIVFEALDHDERGQKEFMSYLQGDKSYQDMFSPQLFKIDEMFMEQDQYFFPYNLDISSSAFKYDKAAEEEGLKVYQAAAYDMPSRFDTIHSFVGQYGAYNKDILYYGYVEKMYRNFVYTYYLQVPEGILDQFSQQFPIRQVQTEEEEQQFITALQQYFQEHYTYTLSPGKVPPGKDFVSYFLNESHEGYCTYFASAATLILRQAGIPARYVVGYAVPKQAVEAENSIGSYNGSPIHAFTITDKQAHAWVEIYEDGWGWRPVDFTPGFMPKVNAGAKAQNHNNPQHSVKHNQAAQNNTDITGKKSIPKPHTNILPAWHNASVQQQQYGLLLFLIVSAGSIAGLVCWGKYCSRMRVRLFLNNITAANQEKRISELYVYMEKLAAYCGKKRPAHMDYLCYAAYLQQHEVRWKDVAVETFITIVLKVRFGTHIVLNEKETAAALTIIQQMRCRICDRLTIWKKIVFIYIHRL